MSQSCGDGSEGFPRELYVCLIRITAPTAKCLDDRVLYPRSCGRGCSSNPKAVPGIRSRFNARDRQRCPHFGHQRQSGEWTPVVEAEGRARRQPALGQVTSSAAAGHVSESVLPKKIVTPIRKGSVFDILIRTDTTLGFTGNQRRCRQPKGERTDRTLTVRGPSLRRTGEIRRSRCSPEYGPVERRPLLLPSRFQRSQHPGCDGESQTGGVSLVARLSAFDSLQDPLEHHHLAKTWVNAAAGYVKVTHWRKIGFDVAMQQVLRGDESGESA